MQEKLAVEYLGVADLKPFEENPNDHPADQVDMIARSIEEFGWTIPVLVDAENNVVAGHGRLMAAAQLGITEVPVIRRESWTDDQVEAYRIADNRIPEYSRWNFGKLAGQLEGLNKRGFDIQVTGFTVKDLESFQMPKDMLSEQDDQASPDEVKDKTIKCPECGHAFEL